MFDRLSQRRMPTTRWTVFHRTRSSDPKTAQQAIAELCEHYQDPIYGYLRDKGESPEDARDLTQGLMLELIEHGTFATMDRADGTARSYLRKAADRYAKDQRIREAALKRGGGQTPLPFDTSKIESRYALVDPSLSPEEAYDRRWAQTIIDRVHARIHAGLVEKGQEDRWEWLAPLLTEPTPQGRAKEIAGMIGKREDAVRAWIFRMRGRFEDYLHQEIADTVMVDEAGAKKDEAADLDLPPDRLPRITTAEVAGDT